MGIFNLLPFLWFSVLMLGASEHVSNSTNQSHPPQMPQVSESRDTPFKPGVAAIVGVITIIFSITFLWLLYMKHCKRGIYANNSSAYPQSPLAVQKNSGIDPRVIALLPMFRFNSLRGQKDGLECAVCLNKFEPSEVLRLLPKCKHAFHVECVDTWLDAHSTCPLCRYRVDPEDILLIDCQCKSLYNHDRTATPRDSGNEKSTVALLSPSQKGKAYVNPRVSGRHSSAGERGKSLEIIVENPCQNSRRSLDSSESGRKYEPRKELIENSRTELSSKSLDSWKSSTTTLESMGNRRSLDNWKCRRTAGNESRKDGLLLEKQKQAEKHRLEHRIIISGAAEESSSGAPHYQRWSDVHPSDLLYLRSEMILGGASLRFPGRREGGEDNEAAEEEEDSGRGVINGRSVSEIIGKSRYRSNGREEEEKGQRHEGAVKRWLAWISQSQQQQQQKTAVQSVRNSESSSSSSIVA